MGGFSRIRGQSAPYNRHCNHPPEGSEGGFPRRDEVLESRGRLIPHPMAGNRRKLRLLLPALAAAAAVLAFAAPAHGALTAPVLLDPGPGASVEALPAFSWSPVPGAYAYEFQVAADQNFNAPVLGRGEGSFATRNTRATLKKTLPNGRYWWRVRATTKSGDVSPWSNPRSLIKAWTAVPSSQSPGPGYPFTFPGAPISLGWAPVPYAASYFVSLASDPALANVVINNGAAARDLGDELRPGLQPPPVRHVLLERHAGRLRGEQGNAVAGELLLLVVAVDDDRLRDRSGARRRAVRPAVLLEPRARRDEVRGRGQLLGRLRARLEGLLLAADDLDVAGADGGLPRQHVLLARPRARRSGQLRRLEPRPRLREDLRQGPAGRLRRASRTCTCATT